MDRFSAIVGAIAVVYAYEANGMQLSSALPNSVKNVRETVASMAIRWSRINPRSIRRESRPLEFNSQAEMRAPSLVEPIKFRKKTIREKKNNAKIPMQFRSREHAYDARQNASETEAASNQLEKKETAHFPTKKDEEKSASFSIKKDGEKIKTSKHICKKKCAREN